MIGPRPSQREIHLKINQALEAVRCGNAQVALSHHLASDLNECGWGEADLWGNLPHLLTEIKVANPNDCYAGSSPPQKSFEPELEGLELWAYCWESKIMNGWYYLKFSIKLNKDRRPNYLHARLHPHRPQ